MRYCNRIVLYLVFSDAVPVEDEKLETDVVQRSGCGRQIENERFIKNGIEGPFLDVGLLFSHSLTVVHQVDLDVRICSTPTNNQPVSTPIIAID